MSTTVIRPECFRPASEWEQPSPDEVREILRRNGLKGADAAILLGLSPGTGGRQIRRWTGGDANIPYAAWAILADMAGVSRIWVAGSENLADKE